MTSHSDVHVPVIVYLDLSIVLPLINYHVAPVHSCNNLGCFKNLTEDISSSHSHTRSESELTPPFTEQLEHKVDLHTDTLSEYMYMYLICYSLIVVPFKDAVFRPLHSLKCAWDLMAL